MNKVEKIAAAVKNLTATDYYRIQIEHGVKPTIFDSKFSGTPYWTAGRDYPVDANGAKMFLLAQINFETFKFDAPFPNTGMLQIFVANNDLIGVDYDNPTAQTNFHVVYHEKIDAAVEIENSTLDDVFVPIYDEYKISFSRGVTHMTMADFRFGEIYRKVAGGEELSDEDYELLRDELETESPAHQMLGYPYFTQEDPRYDGKFADYDTLLLQIDSDGEYVMWGDAGVANFFIKRQDLVDRNFGNVLYHWDCC